MRRGQFKTVKESRGMEIDLDLSSGKFFCDGLGEQAFASLKDAESAVEKFLKTKNKTERRPVLVWEESYGDDDSMLEGELTSFSARRGYRKELFANVMIDGARSERDPRRVYELTSPNRLYAVRLKEIVELLKQLRTERDDIIDNKMERAKKPSDEVAE
jgi:hypothetical protein